MKSCTFFGHRDTPYQIEPILQTVLLELIEHQGITNFYVGNQGNFDKMVKRQLQTLQLQFPSICYSVVLAYFPHEKALEREACAVYPAGLESVPPKYAINERNHWMIRHADIVVAYVKHPFGGAAKWVENAQKRGLAVLNLAESSSLTTYVSL